MKHLKTVLLSIIASVAIVYLITITFGTFTISYHPTTKDIEQNNYSFTTKFSSVLGIKIEVEEFHTNERDVLNALKNSLNFSTKFSYYNQAVKLSIRYILILTPLLFLFLYNREKNMTC
ncbi:hypothetical protein [Flavobacterium sp.]|jgi:hypothetical protein|uniref:hypothetical protein n=1 Tax=Flavobacterium sp. TaxID=239 RepID=UPI003D26FD65